MLIDTFGAIIKNLKIRPVITMIALLMFMVMFLAGCAAIPIPNSIPIPKIPILGWFL